MIRVGLIGLGAMGGNHLRVLSELDGVRLTAVCDQDPRRLEVATRKHSVKGYATWDEMLEREPLDAAVVAVPTRFHCQAGLAALEHGLHVLIEKPISTDLEEGRRLVAAAKSAKKLLAVGHVERFNPAVRELQRRLAVGEAGRLFQVQARRLGPFPARIRDVGVVIDLATHDLDVISHIAASEVTRVFAETEQRIHTEHEDILNALLKFENGMIAVLQVNWLTPTKIRELSVLGEKGMFVCNYMTQELTFFRNADAKSPHREVKDLQGVSEGDITAHPVAKGEPLRLELESFFGAVRGENPLEVDGEDGLRALHLALALIRAAAEAQVVDKAELADLWTVRYAGSPNRDDL